MKVSFDIDNSIHRRVILIGEAYSNVNFNEIIFMSSSEIVTVVGRMKIMI